MMFLDWLRKVFVGTVDIPDPKPRITINNIIIDGNSVIIKSPWSKLKRGSVQNTESMNPVIDAGHTALYAEDFDKNDLQVGDIVVAQRPSLWVLHRIVEIGFDDKGRYFRTKGDNVAQVDPVKVRDIDLKWLVFGIIY